MALMKCPECGHEVSTMAGACPGCGYPIGQHVATQPAAVAAASEPLLEVRPSWWRYFWHLVFAWLIVPFIIAWFHRRGVLLRVYADRITLERGLFTKCYREFFIRDIRAIDIDQGLLARMVGIGDLTISTAATVDAAERIEGVPDPMKVKDLIIAHRQKS